ASLIKPRRGPLYHLATHRRGEPTHMHGKPSWTNMYPRLDVPLGVAPFFTPKSSRAHVQAHA
ncbi:hypothetical protein PIB30_105050, partial [Stylosanthes scabra]|nr:hypothetical protein [Stylosanthes scabra]